MRELIINRIAELTKPLLAARKPDAKFVGMTPTMLDGLSDEELLSLYESVVKKFSPVMLSR